MKNMFRKKGQPKARPEFPVRTGMVKKSEWKLSYNKGTRRYDLKVDEKMSLSSVSLVACETRAADKGVVWNKAK